MDVSSFRSAPNGAYVAAGAQIVAIAVAIIGFAGPPPLESQSMVTITLSLAYWIAALWIVSLIATGQAFVSLTRQRNAADTERDGAYVERDRAKADLDQSRKNQALSDQLSDQWDFGIHELLNKPPIEDNDQSFTQWNGSVHRWTQAALQIMKDGGCTKQDVRRVNTLGVFPTLVGFHKNPGVTHAMSMLVERLNRVGEVAKKYGD
jgi:hypothetical protein